MFENFLLERPAIAGEAVRIAVAIIGTAIASWYDVRNNRNVPNNLLYAFLGLAFLSNIIFYQENITVYSLSVAAIVFALGYLFYKVGYIGGADVYVLASIALLIPAVPSYIPTLLNFPPVLSVIITSGVFFALYFLWFIITTIALKNIKGKFEYLLLIPIYAVLLYFLLSSGVFGFAYIIAVSTLLLASIIFMVYKEKVVAAMARKVPLSKVDEEDVAVPELMPALAKKYKIKRLLEENELKRLKKEGVKEIYVYKELPPFLPFVLAGLLITVVVGDILTYSLRM